MFPLSRRLFGALENPKADCGDIGLPVGIYIALLPINAVNGEFKKKELIIKLSHFAELGSMALHHLFPAIEYRILRHSERIVF